MWILCNIARYIPSVIGIFFVYFFYLSILSHSFLSSRPQWLIASEHNFTKGSQILREMWRRWIKSFFSSLGHHQITPSINLLNLIRYCWGSRKWSNLQLLIKIQMPNGANQRLFGLFCFGENTHLYRHVI